MEKFESTESKRKTYVLATLALLQMTEIQTALGADLPESYASSGTTNIEASSALDSLNIAELANYGTAELVIPSSSGKYVIQIDQVHFDSRDPSATDKKTIRAQQEIESALDYLLTSKPDVKICPEGIVNVSEYEYLKNDLENLQESFIDAKSNTVAREHLTLWIKNQETNYSKEYARKLQYLGAALFERVFQDSMNTEDREFISKLNPFGPEVISMTGAVEKMYIDGSLNNKNLLACEDLETAQNFITSLQKVWGSNAILEEDLLQIDRALVAREDHIAAALSNYLDSNTSEPYVVLVLGAIHDLSDNIAKQNNNQTDVGYIRIKTPTTKSYAEELLADID
jgi:hypothetical protein